MITTSEVDDLLEKEDYQTLRGKWTLAPSQPDGNHFWGLHAGVYIETEDYGLFRFNSIKFEDCGVKKVKIGLKNITNGSLKYKEISSCHLSIAKKLENLLGCKSRNFVSECKRKDMWYRKTWFDLPNDKLINRLCPSLFKFHSSEIMVNCYEKDFNPSDEAWSVIDENGKEYLRESCSYFD